MAQSLEDLKAENAAALAQPAKTPQVEPEELEPLTAQDDDDDQTAAELDDDESEASVEPEDWMKGDDQTSQQAGKKFTDSDIGAAKSKLRAKLEAKHQTELDDMRAKLEQAQRAVPQQVGKPKREDFYESDDPDDAYIEALTDWKMGNTQAQQSAQHASYEQQRKQIEQKQAVEQSVDQHYERAVKLAEASGISPELYQSADLRVRSAIESVFPKGGDAITDTLISNLGEGSERVFYNLGVNQARLSELKTMLAQDPSGLKASIFLGKLSAELSPARKRTSNAPKPATQIHGDKSSGESGRALQRKYDAAHSSGKGAMAFDIKQKAKAQGINTKTW